MQRTNYREKILDVAGDLFYRNGIHATGVDTIIAASDIARMTLYKHFPSKEALIEAVLRRQMEETRRLLEAIVGGEDTTPQERLDLLFDGLERTIQSPDFFGCPFINATAEYGNVSHPFHQLAAEYKRMYRDIIRRIVDPLAVSNPTALATQLFLLVEGALVSAQVGARQGVAAAARAAAHILLDFHCTR